MIQVENLVKKYGKHTAVDGISFTVEEGMICGFLGQNGAGKSTTMNIITGYLAATEGKVSVNGYDIVKETAKAKKCIGYLPENPPLYPDMTVSEYLDFVAGIKQIPKKEKKQNILSVMKEVAIDDVAHRLIRNLSKGYRQRVGIAQALLGNPEVIILDEPTVGLDPRQIIEIRELISNIKKNHTVILSSHILAEVGAVCDQIMIISHGKMVAKDSTQNLFRNYKGQQKLTIVVKQSFDKVKEVLTPIDDIEEIRVLSEANQETKLELTAKGEKDIREEVSFALSDARILIIEMSSQVNSLENVFLELTSEEHLKEILSEDTPEGNTEDLTGQSVSEESTGNLTEQSVVEDNTEDLTQQSVIDEISENSKTESKEEES